MARKTAPALFLRLTIIAIGNGVVAVPICIVASVKSTVPFVCSLNVGAGTRVYEVVTTRLVPAHSGIDQSCQNNCKSPRMISFI